MSKFRQKTSGSVVKAACYASKGTLWEGKRFWKILHFIGFLSVERKYFGVLAKVFRQGCENCILRVQGNNFSRIFSENYISV